MHVPYVPHVPHVAEVLQLHPRVKRNVHIQLFGDSKVLLGVSVGVNDVADFLPETCGPPPNLNLEVHRMGGPQLVESTPKITCSSKSKTSNMVLEEHKMI